MKHQYDHAVHSAMGLFQEEPDEPDGPALFQAESDRVDWFPLQDEGDEPDDRFLPSQPSQPSSTPQPFQDEDDEADCDSDSSGCLADGEVDVNKDKYQELVQLNFATLTKFLESQLSQISATASTGQPVKKRRYNNRGRAAKAAASKQPKESQGSKTKRIPRNNTDTCLV